MVDQTKMPMEFWVEVFKEGKAFVAVCPELNVSSFGPSPTAAKEALREAVAAFVEGCVELGTLEEVMEEARFLPQDGKWVSRHPVSQERLTLSA